MGLGAVLGGEHLFRHNDKEYRVRLVTHDVLLAYERALFTRARDAARELRSCMTPEEYQSHLQRLNDGYMRGEYSLQSELGQATLKTAPGMISLCALLWQVSEDEMLRLLTECGPEVASLLEAVVKESFPAKEG